MISADHFWLLAVAIVLDALFGDPEFIWARAPHPVAIMGSVIGFADRLLNREHLSRFWRRILGAIAIFILAELAFALGYLLQWFFDRLQYGWYGTAVIASVMLAGRSLFDHVRAVANAPSLDAARSAVSEIVGRDPASLDEARICRAAIESTAENFSDGVIAPALWFLVLGLPGLIAYKAINTADSMIGHLTDRYKDFGWAAARLDDLVNLPASRLAGLLLSLAAPFGGGSIATAFRTMWREARKHRSPNAGWPEGAMAGALDLALAGPRRYGGLIVNDPFLNEHARRDAMPADIRRGVRVYLGANAFFFAAVGVVALAVLFWP